MSEPINDGGPAFTRVVEVRGAFDKRATGHGIHGMDLLFVLKGEKGAMQFLVYTNIQLPHVAEQKLRRHCADFETLDTITRPMGADIGYHAREPQYEGQEQMQSACSWLDGAPCYYDGSSLAADEFMPTFIAGGSDAVWKMLEERYHERFADAMLRAREVKT